MDHAAVVPRPRAPHGRLRARRGGASRAQVRRGARSDRHHGGRRSGGAAPSGGAVAPSAGGVPSPGRGLAAGDGSGGAAERARRRDPADRVTACASGTIGAAAGPPARGALDATRQGRDVAGARAGPLAGLPEYPDPARWPLRRALPVLARRERSVPDPRRRPGGRLPLRHRPLARRPRQPRRIRWLSTPSRRANDHHVTWIHAAEVKHFAHAVRPGHGPASWIAPRRSGVRVPDSWPSVVRQL